MNPLAIIIDGYNFLKTTGMMSLKVADDQLRKGRSKLVGFLKQHFPSTADGPKLIVVYDSQTIWKLPKNKSTDGIEILFARDHDTADDLIIELIRGYPVPKRLLVVSSDHQIQTAARRRKATPIDSDVWLEELEKRLSKDGDSNFNSHEVHPNQKPPKEPVANDTQFWVDVFKSTESELSRIENEVGEEFEKQIKRDNEKDPSEIKDGSNLPSEDAEPDDPFGEDFDQIFPPGYGEDLLE